MDCNFNMNLLDFEQNKKVRTFVKIEFGRSMISIIKKPTCIGKKTATAFHQLCYYSKIQNRNYKIGYFGSFSNFFCDRLQYTYKRSEETLHN